MGTWEPSIGATDEWYTPKYVFDALGCQFDLDVASPPTGPLHVPATCWYSEHSLELPWFGFVWMNPPFGGRNGLMPWLNKFFDHGDGIALTPDRTSPEWFHTAADRPDAMLFVRGKIKFIRPDGSTGDEPSNGTVLWGAGERGCEALRRAGVLGLGILCATL